MVDPALLERLAPSSGSGKLAENVMHFARLLRATGLPVGPHKVLGALEALQTAGVDRRDDFYWTLASVFIDRREQFEMLDQAFHIFWRDPKLLERAMAMMMPAIQGRMEEDGTPPPNRLAEALMPKKQSEDQRSEEDEVVLDASFTASEREVLQRADFETMTNAELAAAKKIISQLRLPIPEVRTRRLHADPRGDRPVLGPGGTAFAEPAVAVRAYPWPDRDHAGLVGDHPRQLPLHHRQAPGAGDLVRAPDALRPRLRGRRKGGGFRTLAARLAQELGLLDGIALHERAVYFNHVERERENDCHQHGRERLSDRDRTPAQGRRDVRAGQRVQRRAVRPHSSSHVEAQEGVSARTRARANRFQAAAAHLRLKGSPW